MKIKKKKKNEEAYLNLHTSKEEMQKGLGNRKPSLIPRCLHQISSPPSLAMVLFWTDKFKHWQTYWWRSLVSCELWQIILGWNIPLQRVEISTVEVERRGFFLEEGEEKRTSTKEQAGNWGVFMMGLSLKRFQFLLKFSFFELGELSDRSTIF